MHDDPPCTRLGRLGLAFVTICPNLSRALRGLGESLGLFEPPESLRGRESKPGKTLLLLVETRDRTLVDERSDPG
ncbi:MAG: hypothetical protein WBG86_01110 [Polyangiales bacterium]